MRPEWVEAEVVRTHVEAFNGGDFDGLLDTLAPDAVWVTGTDRFVGHGELRPFFESALTELRPALEIRRLLAGPGEAMVELVERLVHDGVEHTSGIVGVYDVEDGRITRATIYREGSADL